LSGCRVASLLPKRSHAQNLESNSAARSQAGSRAALTFPNPFGPGILRLEARRFCHHLQHKPLLRRKRRTGQTLPSLANQSQVTTYSSSQYVRAPRQLDDTNIVLNGRIRASLQPTKNRGRLDVQWSGAVAPGANIKICALRLDPRLRGRRFVRPLYRRTHIAAVMSESTELARMCSVRGKTPSTVISGNRPRRKLSPSSFPLAMAAPPVATISNNPQPAKQG